MRTVKAFVVAPMTAPILYWVGSLLAAMFDPTRTASVQAAVAALGLILLFGGPIAYLATLVAVAPAIYLLRRWRRGAIPVVLLLGAVVGVATSVVVGPYLRGELVSAILTRSQGAVLGCASAGVFCWLNLRSAGAG
jgi:hypothetical protein